MGKALKQNLAAYHTFGLSLNATQLSTVQSVSALKKLIQNDPNAMILGDGSNVLFCEDFTQSLLVNRVKGIEYQEDSRFHYFHVNGGESWPKLVQQLTLQGFGGLENLALIPGRVGSAPIQNIGAYGAEFAQVCDYVDYLDRESGQVRRLETAECGFGYRESIFKQELRETAIIVAVGLKLKKDWLPNIAYAPLAAQFKNTQPSAKAIFDAVVNIRQSKLPDPKQAGNAGSFFKNPLVDKQHALALKANFSDMPIYGADAKHDKLAAGWLIDQCGLKGLTVGQAQVHPQQALVLTNLGLATPKDVLTLAHQVQQRVEQKFDIQLEPEVRFFNQSHEVSFEQALNHVA